MAFLGIGKKKEQPKETAEFENFVTVSAPAPAPLERVVAMKQQGYTNEQITQDLQQQGYTIDQISDAISQAQYSSNPPTQFYPQQDYSANPKYQYEYQQQYPTQAQQQAQQQDDSRVQQFVEAIIEEKWKEFGKNINAVIEWKEKTEARIVQLQQQIKDMKDDMDSLKRGILGKITEYDKNIVEVGTEIKAMEKVFQKVLPSLTESVNRLEKMSKKDAEPKK